VNGQRQPNCKRNHQRNRNAQRNAFTKHHQAEHHTNLAQIALISRTTGNNRCEKWN
jgi:hypothetical protein